MENTGSTKAAAEEAIRNVTDGILSVLAKGEEVALTGFGKFDVADRPERPGRNPATGEVMTIPAKKTPRFKAGKLLKEAVI